MTHFLDEYPDLQQFHLTNARPTNINIGIGSYGSVEEVEIPGAICAAKKIHDFFQNPGENLPEDIEKATREFVQECKLLSTLRHPHIVQFLGICFFPGSRMPAIVMEKMMISLHEVLDPKTEQAKTYLPMFLKHSILHNVASGLSFLHNQFLPIIHRDLSAKNVLLNEGMVAKIADLGMARILPNLKAATMTKAPGASIYMPPEALDDESRYDATIDIFSIGVLAIFTLSESFPNPLGATYTDEERKTVARTELERRSRYMQQIYTQLQDDHPLVRMIQQCLMNHPQDRPTIYEVLVFLTQAKDDLKDSKHDVSKLVLLQNLMEKDEHIELRQQQNEIQKDQIELLQWQLDQKEQENTARRHHVESLQREIQLLKVTHSITKRDEQQQQEKQPPQITGNLQEQIHSQISLLKPIIQQVDMQTLLRIIV